MEERDSECDLVHEIFDRLSDCGGFVVEHVLKMRSNNFQHQHFMLSVRAFYLETMQETEDVTRLSLFA